MLLIRPCLKIILLFLCLWTASATAQYALSSPDLERIPSLPLPAQDNQALLAKELKSRRPGRAITFAVGMPVKVRPSTHGVWSEEKGQAVWRLRIRSEGAKTLNLGFSEYRLPQGASLLLRSPSERLGPFTRAQNEEHNQFWTPIVEGDEMLLELRVPPHQKKAVQLYLTAVNHDFEGITKIVSGSCNLDVACTAADGWGIVDGYRDIIRSVAAYTLQGVDACTGFLVNNTNEDGTPFFMTANHCGVSVGNAPSIVAYWNFQSAVCRQPFSTQSGQTGVGNRNIFNSGASLLANWSGSDFTLTLLDDPVNPSANAFFAGWDANPGLPSDTTIAVHHPGVDEKRISFSFQQTFRVASPGASEDPEGSLLQVPDWNIGTTEGGSSGSPIFDAKGFVRGQLFGGQAACGNDLYDVYGYFPVSWEGDGSPNTRLKDWLNPCGDDTRKIGGMEATALALALLPDGGKCQTVCAGGTQNISFTAGSGFPAGTRLGLVTNTPGLDASLNTEFIEGEQRFVVTVEASPELALGRYDLTLTATTAANDIRQTVSITVQRPDAAAPQVVRPLDGATEVNTSAQLAWAVEAGGRNTYDLQVSTRQDFATVVYVATDRENTILDLPIILEPVTEYFWRVRANTICGPGDWAVFSFTTRDEDCVFEMAADTPVNISRDGTPTITSRVNTAVTTPVTAMEVTLAIEHSFVGDLSATLTSPSGVTIDLFGPILGGSCGGTDMSVTFTDAASRTQAEFLNTCSSDRVSVAGTFQPAQSLAVFNGESPAGTWILTVNDNANFDGGALVAFSLNFCAPGTNGDFQFASNDTAIEACVNESLRLDLDLGADFGTTFDLQAAVGDVVLEDVRATRTGDRLAVTIGSWRGVPEGAAEILFTATSASGIRRQLGLPFLLSAPVSATTLVGPPDGATTLRTDVTFSWEAVSGQTNYRLEYADNESFAPLLGSVTRTNSTNATVFDLPGGRLFWRVVASNGCGAQTSTVNVLNINSTSTEDVGLVRQLQIFPNPARRQVTVAVAGAWPATLQVALYDGAGRQIEQYALSGSGQSTLPLVGIPAGVYYLRFNGTGFQRTERIVVLP